MAHSGEINKAPVPLLNAQFSKMLYDAYVDEGLLPNGSMHMPRLFICSKVNGNIACELTAKEWIVVQGPSDFAGKLFTPLTEDAVFDAMEYMKVAQKIQIEDDTVTTTKSLELSESDKSYSLMCTKSVNKNSQSILFAQCALYNGVQETNHSHSR